MWSRGSLSPDGSENIRSSWDADVAGPGKLVFPRVTYGAAANGVLPAYLPAKFSIKLGSGRGSALQRFAECQAILSLKIPTEASRP